MPRTNDTFAFVAANIDPWDDPQTSDAIGITGWNALRTDLVAALSESFRRDGNGTMSGPLKLTDGTAGAPSLTLTTEPTTGLYKKGSGQFGVTIEGVLVGYFDDKAAGSLLINDLGGTARVVGYRTKPIRDISGLGTQTMALTDEATLLVYTTGGGINIVFPTNAAVAFPLGTQISFYGKDILIFGSSVGVNLFYQVQNGASTSSGVTGAGSTKTSGTTVRIIATKIATNDWDLQGTSTAWL